MKKPKAKTAKLLDWSECTTFIEKKYKCDTSDYARSHRQFDEWCKARGKSVIYSRKDIAGAQRQWSAYQSAIWNNEITERPYQCFLHWLIDVADVHRGGQLMLDIDMGCGAEPWQKEILGLYLKEFGPGPYLTDW